MEAMHADGMHVHTWEWSTALIKSERNPPHLPGMEIPASVRLFILSIHRGASSHGSRMVDMYKVHRPWA